MADVPCGLAPVAPPTVEEPEDFAVFWQHTLEETASHPLAVQRTSVSTPLTEVSFWDLSFAGFGGHRVRAWLSRPFSRAGEQLPVVLQVPGYGRGRGLPGDNVAVAASGMAHLLLDVRGQGFGYGTGGDTPDPGADGTPEAPGVITRGIERPETYYYRRLITDAVRAVSALRSLEDVDSSRVIVMGNSQGGGVALAVAGLVPDLLGLTVSVPFLCDVPEVYRRAQGEPYSELRRYLGVRRAGREQVLRTLSYVDGVNHARRAVAPSLWAVGMCDVTCPPEGSLQALAAYAGPAQACIYPDNGHEGGEFDFLRRQLEWMQALAAGGPQ